MNIDIDNPALGRTDQNSPPNTPSPPNFTTNYPKSKGLSWQYKKHHKCKTMKSNKAYNVYQMYI